MERAGKILNLKGHIAGRGSQLTYGPGDLEGHCGFNGNYYVLDFARVFPPQAIVQEGTGSEVLYELLRPELVCQWPVPLSSDAFTGWSAQDPEARANEIVIEECTRYLINECIPKVSKEFSQLLSPSCDTLITFLHNAGINLRHLGRVYNVLVQDNLPNQDIVIVEMFARAMKNTMRSRWRKILKTSQFTSIEKCLDEIVLFLNLLLHNVEVEVPSTLKNPEEIPNLPCTKNLTPLYKVYNYMMAVDSLHTNHATPPEDVLENYSNGEKVGYEGTDASVWKNLRRKVGSSFGTALLYTRIQSLWEFFHGKHLFSVLIPRFLHLVGVSLCESYEEEDNFWFLTQDIKDISVRSKQMYIIDLADVKSLLYTCIDHLDSPQLPRISKVASEKLDSFPLWIGRSNVIPVAIRQLQKKMTSKKKEQDQDQDRKLALKLCEILRKCNPQDNSAVVYEILLSPRDYNKEVMLIKEHPECWKLLHIHVLYWYNRNPKLFPEMEPHFKHILNSFLSNKEHSKLAYYTLSITFNLMCTGAIPLDDKLYDNLCLALQVSYHLFHPTAQTTPTRL
eukprot:TRINITY_DN7150_c0_g2_i5.p1 TRINITY_DN7150_c0_g2~~TRINITY_DN7150_c0_g2_i5.p1  ORF type:complete len:563 (+),score=108.01 TRINITY_DN7150_c0_g2_i5:821-2509(+)